MCWARPRFDLRDTRVQNNIMTKVRNVCALLLGTLACLTAQSARAQTDSTSSPQPAPGDSSVAASNASPSLSTPAPSAPQSPAQDASSAAPPALPIGLWGLPVKLQGFHLQIGFGVGGGPDTSGLFHSMEIGYTFKGHTVALLHTFIQNKGILGTDDSEPELIGGWMVEYKHPLFFPDLVYKVALGLGGIHEQEGGIKAYPGIGVSYGLDLNLPVHPRFGPTLTVAGMNVTARGQHHFGVGCALGFTVF